LKGLFGYPVIGITDMENGAGFPAIGSDLEGPMGFGCQVIGKREEEVGYGVQDIGNTAEISRLEL
jgi:hypothetical protein